MSRGPGGDEEILRREVEDCVEVLRRSADVEGDGVEEVCWSLCFIHQHAWKCKARTGETNAYDYRGMA